MEIRGDSSRFAEIRGDLRRFVEIRGDSWRFVGIRGDSWRFVEIRGPCSSVVFHIRGNSWGFVGLRGVLWRSCPKSWRLCPATFQANFPRVEHLKHISQKREWTESVPRHSVRFPSAVLLAVKINWQGQEKNFYPFDSNAALPIQEDTGHRKYQFAGKVWLHVPV